MAGDGTAAPLAPLAIELRDVWKRFPGTAAAALRGVSLRIPAGRRVALIGPNGSGKSTLTRIIMGLLACEGQVLVDGRAAFTERVALAHRLAYVPQIAPQLGASVGEVLAAVALLRDLPVAAVEALADALDLPLSTLRPRPFRHLSGGMKQKLLLALALATRAPLFILDEPTASLDARARARFFDLYRAQAQGATLLLCSHRLEEVQQLVDHAVALQDGQVLYDGPAEEARLRELLDHGRGA